jgi:hypothetical protein
MKEDVFETKKHTNVNRKAEYRRVGKYYKGLERFKVEKARRSQILELLHQGLTIRQIAEQLQLSVRTVNRDLAKMKSYINKQHARLIRQADEDSLDYFNSLSLKQQTEYMLRCRDVKRRMVKTRTCKALLITIDVDKALGGRYSAVTFKPDLPVEMLDNGKITLQLQAQGRTQPIARIYVGKIVSGSLNLQTNQSMNQFITPALKGLKIVESNKD